MYKLIVAPSAQKSLKKVRKIYQQAVRAAILEIKEDPFVSKPLSEELNGRYSLRVGVYRIIYTVNHQNKSISIVSAGHRSLVYS